MLRLTRSVGEKVVIGDGGSSPEIIVKLLRVMGNKAEIGFVADRSIPVMREEVVGRATETSFPRDSLQVLVDQFLARKHKLAQSEGRHFSCDPYNISPHVPPEEHLLQTLEHLKEELEETVQAVKNNDLEEWVDGLCDSIYVLLTLLSISGIPAKPFLMEVARNNLRKFEGDCRIENGKLIKPKGHPKPEIARMLEQLKFQNLPPGGTEE